MLPLLMDQSVLREKRRTIQRLTTDFNKRIYDDDDDEHDDVRLMMVTYTFHHADIYRTHPTIAYVTGTANNI